MILIIKDTLNGDMPVRIRDDVDFYFSANQNDRTLRLYAYYEKTGTKEQLYKFDSKKDLTNALKHLSESALEYQEKILKIGKF
jgi:hypothetical protein